MVGEKKFIRKKYILNNFFEIINNIYLYLYVANYY